MPKLLMSDDRAVRSLLAHAWLLLTMFAGVAGVPSLAHLLVQIPRPVHSDSRPPKCVAGAFPWGAAPSARSPP